ncbi:PorP/SprF family type IX secretion system membrane protein [Aquimarina agarilytica]|uniref:PorP/SprF family type IX secretion system membrane protein n=1 Tax=Aquimarina agarilytica TaxID=1087449 RepID=UPI000288BD4B|nr:type IX secretion system membrane protein PorP/SprF [Aquimarina agarilytica]
MEKKFFRSAMVILGIIISTVAQAQQDPQYTQYMYNPSVVNPAYAGSRDVLSIVGLHRSQWVGVEGAPRTQTLGIHSPIGIGRVGLGGNIVHDEIGPSQETYLTADFSYTIPTSEKGNLSFGIKAGAHILDVDFTKLNISDAGDIFDRNIDNKVSPNIGLGLFYYTDKFYLGLSAPNLLQTRHFDNVNINTSTGSSFLSKERVHYYITTGRTFDLSSNVKFKPAILSKIVFGAPLQLDLTANFLIWEKLTLGAAYRWSAAWSALAGFQISDSLMIGFGYDRETTPLGDTSFNDGSYEVMMRFELFRKQNKIITPRFF